MDFAAVDFKVEAVKCPDPAEVLVQINGLDDGVHRWNSTQFHKFVKTLNPIPLPQLTRI